MEGWIVLGLMLIATAYFFGRIGFLWIKSLINGYFMEGKRRNEQNVLYGEIRKKYLMNVADKLMAILISHK